uniref:U5 small nuclear ribonucleoprotein TSSC4 n=1 Tax=Gadus morhua TaxID=8049 RepID=A0A8C5CKG1_GADMO
MCDRLSAGGGREPRIRGGVVKVPGDLELSDSDPEDPGAGPPLDAEVRELNSSSEEEEEEEEEVATVRCGRPLPAAPLSNFSLKGGNSSFSFRSRNIFDCLDTVAKETSSPGKDGVDGAVDGVFVRPSPPPPLGCGKKTGGPGAPDYLLHPERWTRYSLEEVAETSDSRNRSVALQYLLSLQQSQEPAPGPEGACFVPPDPSCAPAPEGSVGPSPHRIIFSRPGRGPGREERGDEGRAAPDGGGRRGGLSHLQEEEEEEDLDCSTAAVPPKEEEEKSEPEVAPEFASFRKAHRKNYRKTSEQEDE